MNHSDAQQSNKDDHMDFWDSLQSEIICSNRQLSKKDLRPLIERNFIFSLFFRNCSQLEVLDIQALLDIKEYSYVILAEFSPAKANTPDFMIEDVYLHPFIKELLHNKNNAIGPLIDNRICILISYHEKSAQSNNKEESVAIAEMLSNALYKRFNLKAVLGIGSMQSINNIYISFIDALSCLQYGNPGEVVHIQDIKDKENQTLTYNEALKHMLDAVRLHKIEAYDYFGLMLNWLESMNSEAKKNKILEALSMASYCMRIDNSYETPLELMKLAEELKVLEEAQLKEWAYQMFIEITGKVKAQSSIDYSNKIVQITRDYLETHYAEDISLEDLAEQVNMSPQYFSKLIKKTTGFNFIDWLSMLRVKKAKELLTNSSLTVKEVCFMVGYKDPNYFSRIFKKRIGITPSDYVKSRVFTKYIN